MRREDDGRFGPRWRAILEARWRIRLQEVTELSMAYHGAADHSAANQGATDHGPAAGAAGGAEDRNARRLLRQAVAARRRLADTEDALGRVKAGVFGRCEQCAAPIAETLLVAAPETRYCARCADSVHGPVAARVPAARR
jgi:RNA polymerase-binding transcription factor DksA